MELKKLTKILIVGCAVLTLAGCHSKRKCMDQDAINDANAAYACNDGAQASGMGMESGFGDQAGGGSKHLASKNTYYFDYDSNAVHSDDKPAIEANASHLAGRPDAKVMLEGHTDPRGSREYNIGLGERRANSVAKILTEKGASPDQIRVVSYGAEKLASNGHTEEDYQQDRRAVIVDTKE